ncbi:hypothetical protein [Thiocapsa bogorovii]|uniref:hypothetical protein n=1 Tax=Thiocapsa bogorovii TaxID=521689 RepID=UPI001E36C8C8|nr:hypothetical protein [Thiocapsa bogorovii]UHD15182.1 hypothetical protein LT988_18145 [Thiocapsa bogorovii]
MMKGPVDAKEKPDRGWGLFSLDTLVNMATSAGLHIELHLPHAAQSGSSAPWRSRPRSSLPEG